MTATRRVTCERCQAVFECTGDRHCWCAAVPYRLPSSPAMSQALPYGDCLCPSCLDAIARRFGFLRPDPT